MIAIGYDYGTTTSWMTAWSENDGHPRIVSMPSALLLRPNEYIFGEHAIAQANTEGKFIKSPKRYIVDKKKKTHFKDTYRCGLDKVLRNFSKEMLDRVVTFGHTDQPACITVTIPNCYDGEQMRFMRESMEEIFASKYGDCRLFLLPEPIAAALYYVRSVPIPGGVKEERYVVTCDIGGGTTDLSVIWICREKVDKNKMDITFRVIATVSDGQLGGDDIDSLLFDTLKQDISGILADEHGSKMEVMKAKEQLSHDKMAQVGVLLNNGTKQCCTFYQTQLKEQLRQSECGSSENTFSERLTGLMQNLKMLTEKAYREEQNRQNAVFNWQKVVLLPVGGSMRIPYLRDIFQLTFPGALMHDLKNEEDEKYNSVVYGAMHYSAIMGNMSTSHIRNVSIVGRNRFPVSIEYLKNRLFPIVQTNMPDGTYFTDRLRPLSIRPDGSFEISNLRLFLRDDDEISETDMADFELPINKTFMSNGRKANEIPIKLHLDVANSEILKAKIIIENIDADGNDFVQEYSQNEILRRL